MSLSIPGTSDIPLHDCAIAIGNTLLLHFSPKMVSTFAELAQYFALCGFCQGRL
jgi:hypothetical protein